MKVITKHVGGMFTVYVNGVAELQDSTKQETKSFLDSLLEMQVISLNRYKQLNRGISQQY